MYWRKALILLLILAPAGWCWPSPFAPETTRSHVEQLNANNASYTIDVGGTADMDNSLTLLFGQVQIAFQNNLSLTIANTGSSTVTNPRLVANGTRRWWSMETLLEEILAGAETDQDKAYLIYDFVRKNRYHDYFVFDGDELHDPVKFLNEFGGGFCDDSAFVGCSLFYHAGLNKTRLGGDPRVRTLKGHMMCEAFVDGGFQFLDIDQQTFYLDLGNGKPVSGNAVAKDHYLAKREQAYGPMMTSWSIGEKAAALFGRDDGSLFRAISGHRMDFQLRPGESIEYRWDNVGKYPSDDSEVPLTRSYWGNSLWTFEPHLTEARFKEDAAEITETHVTYEMSTPYPLCGGRITAGFRAGDNGPVRISVSLDNTNWREVWAHEVGADTSISLSIDDYLDYKLAPPKYSCFIRIQTPPADIKHLRLETDLMASPLSLPRVCTGENEIVYTDETSGPHEVTLTHQWRESSASVPPGPPDRPLFPGDGAIVKATTFSFQWGPVLDADLYHLQVSRHSDMRYAYRPSFDVFVDGTTHGSPFAGLFNPEEKYYWRVKARNTEGLWGDWSPVWSFYWDGPRIPVGLTPDYDQEEIVLHWKPNPQGAPAVLYEVYGSDEKGFTPSKTPYDVLGLGRQPSNLLGSTTGNFMLVVAEGAENSAMNRAFYRVVAIDANGVASGPSALLELPHPYVYSSPVTTASVDRPYEYRVLTLASLGDLQQRYVEPGAAFWEKEGYEFELDRGPDWLTLDLETGVLRGQPSATDTGSYEIVIVVHRTYPFEQKRGTPSANFFQKDHAFFRDEHLQRFQLHVE